MQLFWFGLTSFKIVSKDVTIFTDPFSKVSGATPPRGAADIVVCSSPDDELYTNLSSISGSPFIVDAPGEYDVKGVFIRSVPAGGKSDQAVTLNRRAAYSLTLEGLTLGFLGNYPDQTLGQELTEEFEDSDILLVPVGNKGTFDAARAANVVNQLEPKIVIPMQYKIPGFSLPLDPVDQFLKEMGGKGETFDKLAIKKADLTEGKTRLVLLSPQRG